MAYNLKLRIGDVVFSLINGNGSGAFEGTAYRLFLSDGRPEVILRFREGMDLGGKRLYSKQLIFNVNDWWRLFYSRQKYILELRGRTMVSGHDFTSAEVYVRKGWGDFPFGYPLDEILMMNLLARGRGILVHACALKTNNGQGLLFLGSSGAGKSTTARLWQRDKDTTVLSDDRIIVRRLNSKFWIYGTPWHGDANAYSPQRVPLHKVFFLRHSTVNSMIEISPAEAAARLIKCSFLTFWDNDGIKFSLNFCSDLISSVPCYELGFSPDESAVNFVKGQL